MCDEQDLCDELNRTILEVPAVGETKPALKYRLFPPRFERKTGNAAPIYRKAMAIAKEAKEEDEKRFEGMRLSVIRGEEKRKLWWGDDVPEELSPEEAAEFIKDYAEFFTTIDEASLCAECDWRLSTQDFKWWQEGSEQEDLLVPVLSATQLLGIGVGHALEQDDLETALRLTRNLFALADNLLKAPMVTNVLVASGIVKGATSCVDRLIASKQSPNLYWALTQIPRFSHHYLRSVESERNFVSSYYPQLKEIDNPSRDDDHDYWREFGEKFLVEIQGHPDWEFLVDIEEEARKEKGETEETFSREEARERLRQEMLENMEKLRKNLPEEFEQCKKTLHPADPQTILDELPAIKQAVLDWGYPPKRVERLCAEHLAAIYAVRVHEELYDEMSKWFGLDFLTWKSFGGDKAEQPIVESYGTQFAQMIVNSVKNPYYDILASAEQMIDALRVVEAIRLHAASHDGKLTKKLDKIACVPVPLDPMTGQSFHYKVEKTAEGPMGILKFSSANGQKYRYEIRILSS